MRLLLDTHVFLWAVTGSAKLKPRIRQRMAAADAVFVSAASIWEIAIKTRLGKLMAEPTALVAAIAESGMMELPVRAFHAAKVAELPAHHTDPFDRLLVAQAVTEPMHLLTADALLAQYSELVVHVDALLAR
jgi:PIN domain nuclease of toxin-antitoxin system